MKTVVISRLLSTFILFGLLGLQSGAQTISGIINTYHSITAINTLTNTISLNTAAGLAVDTRVLVIQMQGATINSTNTNLFGNINSTVNAGNYEFNYVCAVAGNDILLSQPLTNSYTVGAGLQIVSVPRYTSVTVTGTVTGSPYNSATGTGGVIALEAQTIFLNSNIDGSALGFAGGALVNFPTPGYNCNFATPTPDFALPLMPPAGGGGQLIQGAPKGEGIAAYITNLEYAIGKQANGGGGGNNHNAGGGGGSNYGIGGGGGMKSLETTFLCHGPSAGIGGLSLAARGYSVGTNRVFLGGGGGAGHQNNAVGQPGGRGGGIVFVTATSIVGTGTSIAADGGRPFNAAHAVDPLSAGGDGGGGGGGGGVVVLNVNSVTGNIQASAVGGRGSDASRTGSSNDCPGSGGGGGGGVVWMRGGAPIANVTRIFTGGSSGTGSPLSPTVACRNTTAGATDGATGAEVLNYVMPAHNLAPICEPLPIRELKSFTGRSTSDGNILQWQLNSTENIVGFEVERTIDRVKYITIAYRNNSGALSYAATDESPGATICFYRLKVVRANGSIDYSGVIRISTQNNATFQWLDMQPNPANREVKVSLFSKENTSINITIFNTPAQPVYQQQSKLSPGYSSITIPVNKLAKGVYWMVIEANGTRTVKTLVKN